MKFQTIKTLDGKPEYVLLPIAVYSMTKHLIDKAMAESEFVEFELEDYIQNPVALARINANLTQQQLANMLGVTQAYISKLEKQESVSAKVLNNINRVIHK